MAQLLDRYRRSSDGKEFAVVGLGTLTSSSPLLTSSERMTLEAEDGERVESQASAVRGLAEFERLDD